VAKQRALEKMTEMKVRLAMGFTPVSRKFASVAEARIQAWEAGRSKKITRSYAFALRRYHIPFLGKHNIDRIDAPLLHRFDEWRTELAGRPLTKSTIQTHNSALNAVFDYGLKEGWLMRSQVPDLWNDGEPGHSRATFTQAEFAKLVAALDPWVDTGRAGLPGQIRFVLRDLILTIAATGIRPGTETENLTWADIDDHRDEADGEVYLRLRVDGKTGSRWVIAPDTVRASLARLRKWNPNATRATAVFAVLDGRYPAQSFIERFRDLLIELGLRVDGSGSDRTLYSLRHYYATCQRMKGIGYEVLKNQMGTSISMLEQHYDHVTSSDEAARLVGKRSVSGALVLDLKTDPGSPALALRPDGSIRLAS
jgi:site-specific recombinase XerD